MLCQSYHILCIDGLGGTSWKAVDVLWNLINHSLQKYRTCNAFLVYGCKD